MSTKYQLYAKPSAQVLISLYPCNSLVRQGLNTRTLQVNKTHKGLGKRQARKWTGKIEPEPWPSSTLV